MSLHIVRDRTKAERILYRIVEGDSDLELSDEENAENEVAPVEARESSEEEAGGSSDELTDTDEQESSRSLWARTSMYVVFSSGEPQRSKVQLVISLQFQCLSDCSNER